MNHRWFSSEQMLTVSKVLSAVVDTFLALLLLLFAVVPVRQVSQEHFVRPALTAVQQRTPVEMAPDVNLYKRPHQQQDQQQWQQQR